MNQEERKFWILLTIFTAMVTFVWGKFSSTNEPVPSISRLHQFPSSRPPKPPSAGMTATLSREAAFAESMSRLNNALYHHAGMTEQELILKVNESVPQGGAKPCPLEWQDGEVELLLAQDQQGRLPLDTIVKGCADSIERLP